jgi:hypothetical protein
MKFTILCDFDPNGIPGYPMTSEDGVQLFDGEGSGYSRIGSVPEANQNMMLVVTSQKTYDIMAADPKIKILQKYDEKTKLITSVATTKDYASTLLVCKVTVTEMESAKKTMSVSAVTEAIK